MEQVYKNCDCMELMAQLPDKFADIAIVDPPYGIGFENYERGKSSYQTRKRFTKNGQKEWDCKLPDDRYFQELFRVSKNQIIWGGNYFSLPPTRGFIFWHKANPVSNFSDGEFAWTSFQRPAKYFRYDYYGNINSEKRIHPTQKPVALYKWLLTNYAKEGDKLLDTHVGSASSLIAFEDYGFEYVACELDKDYYEAGIKRLEQFRSQLKLF